MTGQEDKGNTGQEEGSIYLRIQLASLLVANDSNV